MHTGNDDVMLNIAIIDRNSVLYYCIFFLIGAKTRPIHSEKIIVHTNNVKKLKNGSISHNHNLVLVEPFVNSLFKLFVVHH